MEVFRLCNKKYKSDISGIGAGLYGGRWNPKGLNLLYTSSSVSLALVETMVHLQPIHLPELSLLTIEVPDHLTSNLDVEELPENWQQFPAPRRLAIIGKEWILSEKSVALCVPSAIVPQSYNYLINPRHPKFKEVKLLSAEDFLFDRRLYQNVFGTKR